MATSEKPISPARIGTRSSRSKPSGPIAVKIPKQSETLNIADNSLENPYEEARRLRIESNNARMAEFGIMAGVQKLREMCPQAKPKVVRKAPVRRDRVPAADIVRRCSTRNKDVKRNYTEVSEQRYRWVEGKPRAKLQRLSKEGKVRTVKLKQIFAIQSDYAVGKAVDDAEAKVSEAEDGRAFAKRMEPSNVSGGYWQQLPSEMQRRWPFKEKIEVELECEDVSRKHSALKKENRLATWQYQRGANEKRWTVIWLPRTKTSAGLSGGWRSFAIDQELTPNDCVVWEVPADVPFGKLPTYVKIHLFRAEDYETEESSRHVITYEEERAKLLKSCEPIEEEDEEEAEEGAEEEGAAKEAGPSGEAADEAGPSQAPAAAQEGEKVGAAARLTRAAKAALAKLLGPT
ncbi:g9893 [Coccomyxa viridis]|uniref:G9893 protein n=1 Tax=Coccomyxa viridis TaxID=1274662 RepID=A0ABP1GA79_9CHLO